MAKSVSILLQTGKAFNYTQVSPIGLSFPPDSPHFSDYNITKQNLDGDNVKIVKVYYQLIIIISKKIDAQMTRYSYFSYIE